MSAEKMNATRIIALLAIACSAIGCSRQTGDIDPNKLVGTWQAAAGDHQLSITFEGNGTYAGKLAEPNKPLVSESEMNLALLHGEGNWHLDGKDLQLGLVVVRVARLTTDVVTLRTSRYEFRFRRMPRSATGVREKE